MNEDQNKEDKAGDKPEGLKIHRGEDFQVKPSFLILRSPETAVVGADYVKYMVDPDCGMGTLVFFRKYPTPKRESRGWSVDTIVEESFLEVKVPLNTLFALAIGLSFVAQDVRKPQSRNMTFFGPSRITQEERKPNDS